MPTGYTSPIYYGEINFEQFMLRCSRNFGALIHMHEEGLDADIPDEIIPDTYHLEEIKEREKELSDFLSNRPTLEELEERYIKEVEKRKNEILEENEKRRSIKARYTEILDKVKAWNPPTEEHESLKKFAIEQLESSIDWDCDEYSPSIPKKEEWIEFEMNFDKHIQKEIDYHRKAYEKEVRIAKSRTEWIQALKKSLNTE